MRSSHVSVCSDKQLLLTLFGEKEGLENIGICYASVEGGCTVFTLRAYPDEYDKAVAILKDYSVIRDDKEDGWIKKDERWKFTFTIGDAKWMEEDEWFKFKVVAPYYRLLQEEGECENEQA